MGMHAKRGPRSLSVPSEINSGDALLSQAVAHQVPSALAVLTSVFGMGTGVTLPPWSPETFESQVTLDNSIASTNNNYLYKSSPRPISTGQLNTLPYLHFRPINVVVYHGPYLVNPVGNLILERASHLYAFSAYPFRRLLISYASGETTDTQELRPSRSSRTRDSLPQVSYGCIG